MIPFPTHLLQSHDQPNSKLSLFIRGEINT
jgi:hypothetical protein